VRALYEKVTKAFTSDITLESISVKVSGLLAYDSGNFHETMVDVSNGAKTALRGSYLMVLAKGADAGLDRPTNVDECALEYQQRRQMRSILP
jgi:hypothetical protein